MKDIMIPNDVLLAKIEGPVTGIPSIIIYLFDRGSPSINQSTNGKRHAWDGHPAIQRLAVTTISRLGREKRIGDTGRLGGRFDPPCRAFCLGRSG